MEYVSADGYMRLDNRGRNPEVETELLKIVSALPTQIKPEDRTALLRGILGDLSCKAVWRRWTQERKSSFASASQAKLTQDRVHVGGYGGQGAGTKPDRVRGVDRGLLPVNTGVPLGAAV